MPFICKLYESLSIEKIMPRISSANVRTFSTFLGNPLIEFRGNWRWNACLRVSQFRPVYPWLHVQMYPPISFTQIPFRQGLGAQLSSTDINNNNNNNDHFSNYPESVLPSPADGKRIIEEVSDAVRVCLLTYRSRSAFQCNRRRICKCSRWLRPHRSRVHRDSKHIRQRLFRTNRCTRSHHSVTRISHLVIWLFNDLVIQPFSHSVI